MLPSMSTSVSRMHVAYIPEFRGWEPTVYTEPAMSTEMTNVERITRDVPERQCVVSHKGLALSDQERAVSRAGLQAVIRQKPLCDLPSVAPCSQLSVEPLFSHMLVHAIGHLAAQDFNHCKLVFGAASFSSPTNLSVLLLVIVTLVTGGLL